MKIGRLIALAFALALVVLYWQRGFGISTADARAVGAVLVIPFLFALVSHRPGEILCAFADAFRSGHADTPVERLVSGASVLEALGRYALAVGVLGTFWSIVGGMNELTRLGAQAVPGDLAAMVGQGILLPALGAALRWFVYAPLAEALRGACPVLE